MLGHGIRRVRITGANGARRQPPRSLESGCSRLSRGCGWPAGKVCHLHPGVGFLEDRHNLALRESTLPHRSASVRPPTPSSFHLSHPRGSLQNLDANRDGTIDADELADAPSALRKLDLKGDRRLTAEEVVPSVVRARPMRVELVSPYDLNVRASCFRHARGWHSASPRWLAACWCGRRRCRGRFPSGPAARCMRRKRSRAGTSCR